MVTMSMGARRASYHSSSPFRLFRQERLCVAVWALCVCDAVRLSIICTFAVLKMPVVRTNCINIKYFPCAPLSELTICKIKQPPLNKHIWLHLSSVYLSVRFTSLSSTRLHTPLHFTGSSRVHLAFVCLQVAQVSPQKGQYNKILLTQSPKQMA